MATEEPERILAIDVGGITQDILLYESNEVMENCPQLIMPARTIILSRHIERATKAAKPIFLTGNLMGGGACVRAIKKHLSAGYKVYATPQAGKTIRDDLKKVEALGVVITDQAPEKAEQLDMRDIDLDALEKAVAPFEIELPQNFAVAVQDHGESFEESNRKFRFEYWKSFIEEGGHIWKLAFWEVPSVFTRMKSVQADAPGAMVMDTGAAAIWGALEDRLVAKQSEKGLVIVNVGNQHTIGVLFKQARIWGLFEHHTALMNPKKLEDYINRLRVGKLSNQEVFDDGGHGCSIYPELPRDGDFRFVAVTGPRRLLANNLGYYLAAPHGDMMLTGCFGLVAAYKATRDRTGI